MGVSKKPALTEVSLSSWLRFFRTGLLHAEGSVALIFKKVEPSGLFWEYKKDRSLLSASLT